MEVICLQDEAFFALIHEVVTRLKKEQNITKDKWLTPSAAMQMLNITSRSYLQKLRDEGRIRFSQPAKRIILYDRTSIETYLEEHAKDTFIWKK